MSNHTPPIVPNVLHVSDQRNPWQLAPIERLATRYHTPTTVATEFGTVDRGVRPTPGKAGLTRHQHLVWCVPSDGAWQRLLDSRAALQQALDALAAELRRLGNYASRLEKAGGLKAAPPRLCPTVIEAPDPDSSELSYWFSNPPPRIERKEISTHTPKMLNVVRDGKPWSTTHQRNHFVCPDDAAWQRISERHQASEDAHTAWQELLSELGTYEDALGDKRYTTAAQAPLELAPAFSELTGAWFYGFSRQNSTQTLMHAWRPEPNRSAKVRHVTACGMAQQHEAPKRAEDLTRPGLVFCAQCSQALELATPVAPSMSTTDRLADTDLTPALVNRLNEAGYFWLSATRTPDGRWHHLIEPRESWARIGSRRRLRLERLEQLLANAEPAPAAITVVEAVAVGIAMMGRDEAQALVTRIKRNLDGMRADLLELYEREGWRALGYDSWRACAVAEFGASAATLYRQLEAAEIERDVRGDSQVEKTQPIPTVQLQAVKDLSPAERKQAFERADALAGERPRTAADVRQAAAEIKPPPARETDDELYTRRARKILDTLDQWDEREHTRLFQEAYGHARQIRDERAYRAMMDAIDRAVEQSGQPKAPKGIPMPPADQWRAICARASAIGLNAGHNPERGFSLKNLRGSGVQDIPDLVGLMRHLANEEHAHAENERRQQQRAAPAAAMIAADLPLAEPAAAARADWWNVGEHTRALQKAIDKSSRNDAIRAAQKLLAALLYSEQPARPRRPASADVSVQTRYIADLEQYALVLEVRLGAVQTFAQPAAPPTPEPEPTGLQLGDIPADSPLAAIEAGVLQINAWLGISGPNATAEEVEAQKTKLWDLSDQLDAPEGDIDDAEWAMLAKAIGDIGEQLLALRQGQAVAA